MAISDSTRPYSPEWEARFWAKVERLGDDECWPWLGAHGPHGHGQFTAFHGYPRRVMNAQRASYLITFGTFDWSMDVCHKCDNPPCVNPRHLFLGNAQDNMRDAIAKGRFRFPQPRHGETNNRSKLTWELVRSIRASYAAGDYLADLSRRFGLARSTLCEVVNGRTWREAGIPVWPRKAPTKRLSGEQRDEVRRLYRIGKTQVELAREFGLSQGHVSRLLKVVPTISARDGE